MEYLFLCSRNGWVNGSRLAPDRARRLRVLLPSASWPRSATGARSRRAGDQGAVAVAMTRRSRLKVSRERTPSSWNDPSAGSSPGSSAAASSRMARSQARQPGRSRTSISAKPAAVSPVRRPTPRVISLPGLLPPGSGVFLVQADEQVDQLTADWLDPEQGGQFRKVDQPVRVPAGPIVVGSVHNPEDTMMYFACLLEQAADLFYRGRYLTRAGNGAT
jgi:hypothetical protein